MAVIALGFSVYAFYVSLIRAPRIEQARMSWDRWASINEKYNEVSGLGLGNAPETKLWPILKEIDYFAYLILNHAINDKIVLRYYKDELPRLIINLLAKYPPSYQRSSWAAWYRNLDKLITEWKIDTPN